MSRTFSLTVAAAIVLIAGFGWIGTTLDFSTVTFITVGLVAVAVVAVIVVTVIGGMEKRDHDRH